MEIYLKGQVLVLDEAHNIEDCARDAASGSFDIEAVTAAMNDCERMASQQVCPQNNTDISNWIIHYCVCEGATTCPQWFSQILLPCGHLDATGGG